MRGFKTLIVFIILLVIGSYIYFYERKTLTTEEREEKEKNVLDFKKEDVKNLILRKGKRLIVCEKEDGQWRMKKPLDVKADKDEVETVLSRLELLRAERKLKEEKGSKPDFKNFGLDEPRMEVSIGLETDSQVLLVGDDSLVGENIYVARKDRDEGEVLVVRKGIFDDLDRDVDSLRDRQVIEVDKEKVRKFLIERGGKIIECKKNGTWRIIAPLNARGDSEKIEEVIDKLNDLEVQDFISEDPDLSGKYGLNKPRASVTVWEGDASRSLLLGGDVKDEDKIYAKRKGFDSIYSVKKELIEILSKESNDLRDRKLVRFENDDVTGIEIFSPVKIVMKKGEEDKWQLTEPVEMEADEDAVRDFLNDLKDVEVEEFVDDAPGRLKKHGLEEPGLKVGILTKEPDMKHVVLFGKKKGSNCFVKREGEVPVFSVSADFLEKVRRDYLTYRNRNIFDFSVSQVKKLVLERKDKVYICEKDSEGTWKMLRPSGAEPETSSIDDIVWDLSSLEAESFAENGREPAAYGLSQPEVKVIINIEGEEKKAAKTLLVGRELNGKYYAKTPEKDDIFEISGSVVDNLMKNLEKETELPIKKDEKK